MNKGYECLSFISNLLLLSEQIHPLLHADASVHVRDVNDESIIGYLFIKNLIN